MNRLTKVRGGKAVLKNQLHIERAVGLLCEYENTGLTPSEIQNLKETVFNLQKRIRKLEDWS